MNIRLMHKATSCLKQSKSSSSSSFTPNWDNSLMLEEPPPASLFIPVSALMCSISSAWDGTLSLNDFCVSAHAFSEKWKRSNTAFPPWLWINGKKWPHVVSQQVDGFLSLEKICLIKPSEDNHHDVSGTGEEEIGFSDKEGIDDATLVVHINQRQVHFYDFHIVYSASYRVPVLYFRGYCSDGRPLQLNEIEIDLPTCSAKVLLESKWTFITQEEHPYVNRPWYMLHPCGTSEWMKLLFLGDTSMAKRRLAIQQYLVSWYSVVSQVIGLRVPLEMVNHHDVLEDYALDKRMDLPRSH